LSSTAQEKITSQKKKDSLFFNDSIWESRKRLNTKDEGISAMSVFSAEKGNDGRWAENRKKLGWVMEGMPDKILRKITD